ncbi:MAG: class I SAM-dependent methyltransferase [Thermoleophilia bacterium]|nr:class I SAM-dependent methyltransferase [Thermoleophilia bacterium]
MYNLETTYWWHTGMMAIMDQILSPTLEQGSKVLDIGCGTGAKMQALNKYCDVWGIDMHPRAIDLCQKRGISNVQTGDAVALPYEQDTFSHAICCEVLQNLPDDAAGIREAYRVLKPGGYYYISEQAYPVLRSQHDISQGAVRRYTYMRLRTMLMEAGFAVERMTSANTVLFPLMAAVRLASKALHPPSRIEPEESRSDLKPLPKPANFLLRSILKAEREMMKMVDLPYGLSIITLARKPAHK